MHNNEHNVRNVQKSTKFDNTGPQYVSKNMRKITKNHEINLFRIGFGTGGQHAHKCGQARVLSWVVSPLFPVSPLMLDHLQAPLPSVTKQPLMLA